MKTSRFSAVASLLAALIMLEGSAATATTLRALSLDQLAARADVVVRGRPVERRSEWRGGIICTVTDIRVEQVLKGTAAPRLRVLQLGGQVGRHAMPVTGVAELTPGAEMVLFLRRRPGASGEHVVVGMSQGRLLVSDDGGLIWSPSAALWDGQTLGPPTRRRVAWVELWRVLGESR